ncbi:MAG: ribosome-binding factor A [Candidatus Niyogibacteria bacterium]|nr:ribosome-binding factor A [Candidatus Niyogibacteria bacterium]
MSTARKEKVAAMTLRIAAKYLVENVGVPGAVVSVTRVIVSEGLDNVKIYFSVFPEAARGMVMRQITETKKDLKAAIARQMPMKFVPNISLLPDTDIEAIQRVEAVLENLEK